MSRIERDWLGYVISYRKRGVVGRRTIIVRGEDEDDALERALDQVRGGFGICHARDADRVDAEARRAAAERRRKPP